MQVNLMCTRSVCWCCSNRLNYKFRENARRSILSRNIATHKERLGNVSAAK